jgi:hypothetical protein
MADSLVPDIRPKRYAPLFAEMCSFVANILWVRFDEPSYAYRCVIYVNPEASI